jgi:hypothetical protein
MPEVKLPGLGGVKLRSMFADHSCQKRYGLIEDTSYPITKENRAKIKKSLEWLSEEERKGKTWGLIEAKEIVFAYPSRILPTMPRFAALLGASGTASPEKFAECVESVFQILRGLPKEKQPENIHIFAIHKMDKARSKVVFYRTYTIKSLNESAKTWQAGGENIPVFDIWVWTDREKKGVKSSEKVTCERLFPRVPEPLETAKILNKVWKIDGTSAGEIPRIKYYQGIELFFSDVSEEDKQHLLHVLVSNYEGLVHYVGNKTHKNYNAILSDKEKENCAVLFPFFGLLLYKQNCYKEEYMESMSYQIGQLLKIADELHTLYCKVVRDGNVPPQLVGNSLFVAASESPVQALAQLSPRICPYISWAKQYRTKKIEEKDKESWKAAWYVRLFEDIANTLHPYITDTVHVGRRLSDLEKAQFFIGYLASVPKREKSNENPQEPKADNQENNIFLKGDNDGK